MTALVAPDVRWWPSWAAMIEDFGPLANMDGSGRWNLDQPPVPTEAGCAAFVAMTELTSTADLDGTRVPSTYFWIAAGDGGDGDELVGFFHLRHALNEFLLEHGGHIGYSVKPSARGRGHATAALRLGLRAAAGLAIERVLITIDPDNEASRRTAEANGGVLEGERNRKLRYWLPT
jgi:predicted acetyltransferase